MVTAHADHVGSLLRPAELLEARRAHAAGELDPPAFKEIEDRAVLDVIRLQEEAGLPVVTDGELRRESFQSELVAAVDGFEGVTLDAWLWGAWHSDELGDKTVERPPEMAVVEPLRKRRSLAAEELTFLRAHTDRTAKVTLPSPTLFGNLWDPERSRGAYPTFDAFMADVVGILVDEVRELARLGATYLQLDAPHYPPLVAPTWRAFRAALPPARRPDVARLLRAARLAARALALLRHRARQRGHRRRSRRDVRLPPVPRQPGLALARVGRLGRDRRADLQGRPRRPAAARVRRRALRRLRPARACARR